MNLIRTEVLLTSLAWALPVLLGSFLAVNTGSKIFLIFLRVVYVPWFVLMCLPFYWFWAGDGAVNLFVVPPLFAICSFLMIRYGRSHPAQLVRIKDWYFFSLAFSAFLTFWIVVLIHVILGRPLMIA